MLLWELASREIPFKNAQGIQLAVWLMNHTKETIPKQCSKPLAKLIQWCWEDKPSERPSMKEALTFLNKNQKEISKIKPTKSSKKDSEDSGETNLKRSVLMSNA